MFQFINQKSKVLQVQTNHLHGIKYRSELMNYARAMLKERLRLNSFSLIDLASISALELRL